MEYHALTTIYNTAYPEETRKTKERTMKQSMNKPEIKVGVSVKTGIYYRKFARRVKRARS